MPVRGSQLRQSLQLGPVRARRRRSMSFGVVLLAVALVGGLGGVALDRLGLERLLIPQTARIAPESLTRFAPASFPLCSGQVRVSCVVDGDTFWLDGVKIRIADINTPETGSPACAAEAAKGRQASLRLAQLLEAGPFELAPADRDEDRYGRKLRIVLRDGVSVGETLVAEGLAHPWRGQKESWC